MGEATQRARAYGEAKAGLFAGLADPQSHAVATAAIQLFERFVLPNRYTGGCYLTTMFLHRYLADERGIITVPVVGYVNDGTDDIMISHAWNEYQGRKVDITLNLVDPQISLSGDLLVLDHALRPGRAVYSYHAALNAAGEAANAAIESGGGFPAQLLRHKQAEHEGIVAKMAQPALMVQHQALAPPGLRYADMRAHLD
ncbi:hypothetical protein HZY97_09565 [Sphingomonas sp. R-74633]|nr:hypothetical protein [Sphingomonas sp. R-74633]